MGIKNNIAPVNNNNSIACLISTRQQDINYFLKDIADNLTEKLTDIQSFGLYDGKAGIALYLFYYAKHFNLPKIENKAFKLLSHICDTSSVNDLTFGSGLAGIGWIIEHLIQNGFIDGNADEILADLDQKFERPINLLDHSLKSGICGYGMYILTRTLNYKSKFYGSKGNKLRNNLIQIIEFLDHYLPYPDDVIENDALDDYISCILFLCKVLEVKVGHSNAVVILKKYIDCVTATIRSAKPSDEWNQIYYSYALVKASYAINGKNVSVAENKIPAIEKINKKEKFKSFGFQDGTAGKFHLYHLLSKVFDHDKYKEKALHYLDLTITGLSKQWKDDQFSNEHYGLLSGLAGTGLVLLSAISKTKLDWDSALLLN